ncbi:MAG TPA: phosphotransferase [Myxococcota bacterium]|nr:phosphotransferase [Myxococcota bacterium]
MHLVTPPMPDPFAAFLPAGTPLPLPQVEALLLQHYGIAGRAKALDGERDQNSHILADNGAEYVLKIHPPAEEPGFVEFQNQALRQIEAKAPDLPVPRVVPTLAGADQHPIDTGAGTQVLRLLTWVSGPPLYSHLPPPEPPADPGIGLNLGTALGSALGRLDRALQGYRHPADTTPMLWNVHQLPQLRPVLACIPPAFRSLAVETMARFEQELLPLLPTLPHQVIHNDANPGNVLWAGADIEGIIDFGDMAYAPRIQELTVAGSYVDRPEWPILLPLRAMIAAYLKNHPLERREVELLPHFLRGRQLVSLAVSAWVAETKPSEREEYLAYLPRTHTKLQRFWTLEERGTAQAFLDTWEQSQ